MLGTSTPAVGNQMSTATIKPEHQIRTPITASAAFNDATPCAIQLRPILCKHKLMYWVNGYTKQLDSRCFTAVALPVVAHQGTKILDWATPA